MGLKVLYERCAGCDIHKKTVTVHVEVPGEHQTQTFATTTQALLGLIEWLRALRSRTWRWKARACTGSPSITCLRRRG